MRIIPYHVQAECPRNMRPGRYHDLRIKVLSWLPHVDLEGKGWTFIQMQTQFDANQPELSLTLGAMRKGGLIKRYIEKNEIDENVMRWYHL